MSVDIGVLVVSASSPSGYVKTDATQDDWVWLNPDTGALKKYNISTGQFDIDIPIVSHTHPELDDVNFTGTVSADGDEGLTGQRTISGYTFIFKKGLLVGFQSP